MGIHRTNTPPVQTTPRRETRALVATRLLAMLLLVLLTGPVARAELQLINELAISDTQGTTDTETREVAANAPNPSLAPTPLLALGVGDAISVQVYGKPELSVTTYVADDGTVAVPLAGNVEVQGLSPAKAGQRIAAAYRQGKYLVDPQVTVFLVQFRSQQVSVLGAVRTPGRFPVESKTTVLDVLAQAGGTNESSGNLVVLLRPGKDGEITRHSIDLSGLSQDGKPVSTMTLRGGDSIFVPNADQFYIHGEVNSPNMYRLEPGMTVIQAISRGGGITPRGSKSRIEIERKKSDGSTETRSGKLNDPVQTNDVIRVKERFF